MTLPCEACHGIGFRVLRDRPCIVCDAAGVGTGGSCGRCKGTGRLPLPVPEREDCAECGGTGRIEVQRVEGETTADAPVRATEGA